MRLSPWFCSLSLAGLATCALLVLAPPPALTDPTDPTWGLYGSPTDVYHFQLYDPVHRRMLMLGESGATSGVTVWSADLDSPTEWVPLQTNGTPPLDDLYHQPLPLLGAVVDPKRDRLLVWGYNPGATNGYQGTFELSFSTMTWSKILPTACGQNYGTSIVYDPVADRVLVISGDYTSPLATCYASNGVSVLDLSGTQAWSTLSPSGTPPTGRGFAAAIYDSRRNRVLLFGGDYVKNPTTPCVRLPLDETWELTLGPTPAWRFLPPVAPLPSARLESFAFYDSLADRMLVFGGKASIYDSPSSDLWSLDTTDPDTARWTHLGNPAQPPSLPEVAILDPVRRVIVAGGGQITDTSSDPNTFTLGARSELTIDGKPTWSTPVPDHYGPTVGGTALLDAARDRILTAPSSGSGTTLAVWAAALEQPLRWDYISLSNELRDGGSLIVDPVRDRIVLFGGQLAGVLQNTASTIPLTGGPPTPLAPLGTPPAARRGQFAVYDPIGDRMLVFGGTGYGVHQPYYNDVWALTFSQPPTWTRLDLTGPRPSARANCVGAFDRADNRLVIFGGSDSLGNKQDLWSFSLATQSWTQLTATGTPPTWFNVRSVSYGARRRQMLFARENDYPAEGMTVWTLSLWDTPTWSTVTPVVGWSPMVGQVRSAVFDDARDMLVLTSVDARAAQAWTLQMVDLATPVRAPLVRLVSATADGGGAHLVWLLAENVGAATVERRADQGPWRDVVTLARDDAGRARYDDAAVEPGHAYDYRLRLIDNGTVVQAGLASVIVPLGSQAVAFAVAPNPASAVPRFVVALPAGVREAHIELFDTNGRRVLTRQVLAGAGSASFAVSAGRSLRPGVYQARLIAGRRLLASARVAVIR